ncbi:MAG TPA: dephospho-CoA kinase [Bacteroidia bacterium]|nr:dephospho-CoA kinase [Bacteroidia bacterium]HRH09460.1 dephospho-CoA kinase [Bacteroidia bacterium]HRH63742.1 dephospho-CoA kinase [Bacteroidia bacterium]
MIQLCITGGIGSGKTTLCRILEQFDIPVFYADDVAKNLLQTPKIQTLVQQTFGDAVCSNGSVDKQKLATIVFGNEKKLNQLNSMIHPAVAENYAMWLRQHQSKKIVAKEAAILFESGSYKQCDKIICVYAPAKVRIQRVMLRSQLSKEEVKARMKKQLPESEKIKRSDFVIYNDDKRLVIPQVTKVLDKLDQH